MKEKETREGEEGMEERETKLHVRKLTEENEMEGGIEEINVQRIERGKWKARKQKKEEREEEERM